MNSHTSLIFIFSFYSIYYLFKSKSRNEFLIILTIFLFLLQFGSFPNRIDAFITEPVNIRPMDIALILLIIAIFHDKFSKLKYSPLTFNEPLLSIFVLLTFIYLISGIVKFGYASLAEFRLVLFFIIILMFVSVCIQSHEMLNIIRSIATYLMPLILLVPLNLILINNYAINIQNRQFNAYIYETVTVGFLAGYLYYQYIDRKFKLPIKLLPVFLIMIPYCSHRTVWAIIFATLPIILYWTKQNKYYIYAIVLGVLGALYFQIDPTFLENRLTAFTNISSDVTGRWRLYIWEAVISQATFFGNGLGARWHVVADVIGEQAMHGAHSGYIQILYYLGYFGVFNILLLLLYYLLKTYSLTIKSNLSAKELFIYRLSFLSLISLMLYMFGYGPDLLSWFFIGFSLKWVYLKKYNWFRFERQLSQNLRRHPII